jgi:uncharacterized protein YecE (DUF72 family)
VALSIVGTAGWTIPASYKDRFPDRGSHLERYASLFNGVEINSSFYRTHKRATYERWAACVPTSFRFAVKIPRTITQNRRLKEYEGLLEQFLDGSSGLGRKLGVFLVQLPPSLIYNESIASAFFADLSHGGALMACEPRHESWFTEDADRTLQHLHVTRVAADPPRAPGDGVPGGDATFAYFRLHGSPRIYYSNYQKTDLKMLVSKMRQPDWCIFDNTAAFHATGNALTLNEFCTTR